METVTIQTATTTEDEYGNEVADWSDPTETDVAGCRFAPTAGSELDSGLPVGTEAVLYAPGTATIAAHDRVIVRGATYEVLGEPMLWSGGYGPSGWQVPLVKVVGTEAGVGS